MTYNSNMYMCIFEEIFDYSKYFTAKTFILDKTHIHYTCKHGSLIWKKEFYFNKNSTKSQSMCNYSMKISDRVQYDYRGGVKIS